MSGSGPSQPAAPVPATAAAPPRPPESAQARSRSAVATDVSSHGYGHPHRRPSVFANWFWFVVKNVIGWLLILTAMVMGPLVPGPGGLPLFLIGFALITFPGKRRITARI